jgi:DNA (cytosine-5)-methyltransferase 1
MGTGGNNTPMVMMPIPIDLRQAVKNSESGDNCGMGVGEPGDNAFTITNGQPHAIAYDTRNHTINEKVNPTLQAKENGGQSLNYINPVFTIGNGQPDGTKLNEKAGTLNCMHDQKAVMICTETKYIIRRLTPLECCRLQGFPDFWAEGLENPEPTEQEIDWWSAVFETHRLATEPDKKPKTRNQIRKWLTSPHSDSAEYRMWGNSLAIPCAYTVLAGITEILKITEESA